MNLQYFHIWHSGDKPMFDFLVKVMCSVWIWAPELGLPTHTVQIISHSAGSLKNPRTSSASLVQVKKKLRWWRLCTGQIMTTSLWLSNLSKGPLDLDNGPPNMNGLWYLHEESQTIPPISRDNDLVPVFDVLDQIQSRGRVPSPGENIQIYPLSQKSQAGIQITCDITL